MTSDHLIASLDTWTQKVRELVTGCLPAGFDIRFAQSYERDHQLELVRDADFVLVGAARVDAEMIRRSRRLRMIQKWGIGVDKIDLDVARDSGIVVSITAGANASPVAEQAIMLMLAVYRRLSLVDKALREGRWLGPQMREQCLQLRGKTVGLVGFGNIGRMVARKLAGFDVRVVYYDPVRAPAEVERALGATGVPRAQLLAEADVVSLHFPGGEKNRHDFAGSTFAAMKPGAILVNTARGDIVDPLALRDALASGRLTGAGLDVHDPEPPQAGEPLLAFDQVVVTPHSAGAVIDNVENVARHAFGNMVRFCAGDRLPPADIVVMPEVLRAPA